ncbi:unnamed protein product [Orchesella dallaii]|uniref:Uncharacterized protein n=1 Tax=Orchesella dallaii TaxID=48710 RepID=A0ABP1QG09_9HEXA
MVHYMQWIIFCSNGFSNFPFVATAYPLLRDYDPVNRVLDGILPEIPRRLFASTTLGLITFFTTNICVQYMLLIICMCQSFENRAKENRAKSTGMIEEKKVNKIEKLLLAEAKLFFIAIEKFCKTRLATESDNNCSEPITTVVTIVEPKSKISEDGIDKGFNERRKLHNVLYILLTTSNKYIDVMIPTMTGVGMAICITCNYFCLTMHRDKNMLMFIPFAACILLSNTWLIMYFCHHATLPRTYAEETIVYWRRQLLSRLNRKQLRAMIAYRFTIGPFFIARKNTALDIMSTIVDYTITLLLA